jgi:hypothetical protein
MAKLYKRLPKLRGPEGIRSHVAAAPPAAGLHRDANQRDLHVTLASCVRRSVWPDMRAANSRDVDPIRGNPFKALVESGEEVPGQVITLNLAALRNVRGSRSASHCSIRIIALGTGQALTITAEPVMADPTPLVQQTNIPEPARLLGYAGLIPFFGLAGLSGFLSEPHASMAQAWLTGYGAVILSFMGGCRWGFAAAGLGDGPSFAPLAISVLPSLYGWAVVSALPFTPAALALAVGFFALYVADVRLTRERGAPVWWRALRLPLSAGAAGALVLAAGLALLG